jgi:hypothetical protein
MLCNAGEIYCGAIAGPVLLRYVQRGQTQQAPYGKLLNLHRRSFTGSGYGAEIGVLSEDRCPGIWDHPNAGTPRPHRACLHRSSNWRFVIHWYGRA